RLAQREPEAARAALERCVRRGDPDRYASVRALGLLVEAVVASGDVRAVQTALAQLRAQAMDLQGPEVQGHMQLAAGRVASALGRRDEAVAAFEAAVQCCAHAELPFERERARLALAEAAALQDRDWATTEARAALDGFERLGASGEAGRASALLRSLGVRG